MNTSLHLPKEVSDRLKVYVNKHKVSKNKLIVDVIKKFLDKEEQKQKEEAVLSWQGIPDIEFNLELDRDFLLENNGDYL